MKRLLSLMLTLLLTAGLLLPCAKAEDTVLEPLWHVPDRSEEHTSELQSH